MKGHESGVRFYLSTNSLIALRQTRSEPKETSDADVKDQLPLSQNSCYGQMRSLFTCEGPGF